MTDRCWIPALFGAIFMILGPGVGAQGGWGWWPPPPQYYYETQPHEEPPRERDPRRRPRQEQSSRSQESNSPRRSTPRRTPSSADSLTVVPLERTDGSSSSDQLESANPYSGRRPSRTSASSHPSAPPPSPGGYAALVWDYSDSASRIARATGVSLDQILKDNHLTWKELREGQVLRVPVAEGEDTSILDPERQRSREVWRGIRGRKQVALTFDAGSERDGLDDLLAHLDEARAAGTFFVTGQFVKKNPEDIRRISEAGFPVYNHSWSHPEFTKLTEDSMFEELSRTEDIVKETTGRSTRPYWRPPFGDRDKRVLRATAAAGYQSIYWTIDTLDSVGDRKSPEFVVDRVLHPSKGGGDPDNYLDGAIILMHVGEPNTAAAVPEIIRGLRERGFELVTVDEILRP